jgi:RNA polymerase sigma-70 factor (ECF subfamily)
VAQDSDLDARVTALLATGDHASAAAAVVRDLGPAICGYLVAVLHSDDDGREVFAETCEQLLLSIERFRGDSSVKTWAYRIAWRTAMRWKSDGFRRRVRPLVTGEESALAAAVRDSTAAYQRSEAKGWLSQVRDALSPDEQSLLILRLDRDMSWSDVAAVMGDRGDDAARWRKRYERLKDKLRTWAERDGLLEAPRR